MTLQKHHMMIGALQRKLEFAENRVKETRMREFVLSDLLKHQSYIHRKERIIGTMGARFLILGDPFSLALSFAVTLAAWMGAKGAFSNSLLCPVSADRASGDPDARFSILMSGVSEKS